MYHFPQHYYLGCIFGILLACSPASLAFAPNHKNSCCVLLEDAAIAKNSRQATSVTVSTTTTTILYASSSSSSGDGSKGDNKEDFDVEAARRQLESMMLVGTSDEYEKGGTESSSKDKSSSLSPLDYLDDLISSNSTKTEEDIELPPPPPLSTIERDRRNAEIQHLKCLDVSDEASSDLWNLWYSDRGATAKKKLKAADALMGNPKTHNMAEKFLRDMINEYGVYFVEPLNRLATLYYLQSKFEESYMVCLLILKIKPWHFGALAGIVQVCIGLGDRDAARAWAEKRLPNMVAGDSFPPFASDGPQNPRRKEWVAQHVTAAKKQLEQLEKDTKKSFGKPDYVPNQNSDSGIQDSDDGAGAWM